LGAVGIADAAAVFVEAPIPPTVQLIFDGPMALSQVGQTPFVGWLVTRNTVSWVTLPLASLRRRSRRAIWAAKGKLISAARTSRDL
jgi:hypothetical protein